LPISGVGGVGEAMMALWPAREPEEAHSAALPVSPVAPPPSVVDPGMCQADVERSHFAPKHESPREQSFRDCALNLVAVAISRLIILFLLLGYVALAPSNHLWLSVRKCLEGKAKR
jgi:hypothetical protein